MNEQHEGVQIWDCHKPIELDKIVANVANNKRQGLPDAVENRVNDNWERFCKKNPHAKDDETSFLISYHNTNECIVMEVFEAGFRYNQYLNRDDTEMKDLEIANQANYNQLGSWIIAVCDHGRYALFGKRIDLGSKKVSGFGGVTAAVDIVDGRIDIDRFLQRKLSQELKEISQSISTITNIGLNYQPSAKGGPKGFDCVYVAEIDGSAEHLERRFSSCSQFSAGLIPIKADPKSLLQFLEHPTLEPTKSCIGGVLNYIGSRYGLEELRRVHSSYTRANLVQIYDTPVSGEVKGRTMNS